MTRLTHRDREVVAEVAANNGVDEAQLLERVERTIRTESPRTAAYDAACREAGLMLTARQCPHGEPLNACDDCVREHREATA
jgi:hypothetical protein